MERRFSGSRRSMVHVRAALEKKLAKPPVAVESSSAQSEILAERFELCAVDEKKFYGADVTVIGAPVQQGNAIGIDGVRGMAGGEVFKDQISAAVLNFPRYGHSRGF